MTVILFITLVFTHLLKYGRSSYAEGLENIDAANIDSSEKILKDGEDGDNVIDDLARIQGVSDKLKKLKKEDNNSELIDNLVDIKKTHNEIIDKVQDIQPLLDKFQGYVTKYKNTIKPADSSST